MSAGNLELFPADAMPFNLAGQVLEPPPVDRRSHEEKLLDELEANAPDGQVEIEIRPPLPETSHLEITDMTFRELRAELVRAGYSPEFVMCTWHNWTALAQAVQSLRAMKSPSR